MKHNEFNHEPHGDENLPQQYVDPATHRPLTAEEAALVDEVFEKVSEQLRRLSAIPDQAQMAVFCTITTVLEAEGCAHDAEPHNHMGLHVMQRGHHEVFLDGARALHRRGGGFITSLVNDIIERTSMMNSLMAEGPGAFLGALFGRHGQS